VFATTRVVEHPGVVGPLTAHVLGEPGAQGRPLTLSATPLVRNLLEATSTAGRGAAGRRRVLALLLNLEVTHSAPTG
jgi:hypothetical protein